MFSTLDREESINYLRALYGSLAAQLESGYGVKTNSSAFSVVTCVTLAAFHEHLDSFPKIFRDHTFPLQTTRQYHLESLLLRVRRILNIPHDSLIKCKEWAKSHHDLGIDLACMVGYIDLLRIHPDLAGEDGSKLIHAYPAEDHCLHFNSPQQAPGPFNCAWAASLPLHGSR